MQPARVGGAELDYVSVVDIGEELAKGDAAVAWNVTNLGTHHWMLGMFEQAAQDRVWDQDPRRTDRVILCFPCWTGATHKWRLYHQRDAGRFLLASILQAGTC